MLVLSFAAAEIAQTVVAEEEQDLEVVTVFLSRMSAAVQAAGDRLASR